MLCLHSTYGDPALTQPGSISTSPGETVKITCTMSGGSIGSYYASWYWQKPGSAPVLVWDETLETASGIPDRFTGSVDSSSNKMHLTITNVQSDDAADYYCAVGDSGILTFGKGTKLNLSEPRRPTVSLLPPSSVQITEKNTATLVCLVSGFNPGAVEIEWSIDGSVRGDNVETSRIQQETDNTFSSNGVRVLTQPESISKSPGKTVKATCTMSGGSVGSDGVQSGDNKIAAVQVTAHVLTLHRQCIKMTLALRALRFETT
ncbi:hypothetical protein chiPu_0007091 [Chiloscyllium punctatum]|uniref:Ig-like domain-containing protein n=1 Tax=Chiloscyllium punctatum TaxID=137246 RepID=A0A401SE28_CHIPU|nr:hypothetical protein [Chiloscyllium punctatum]